MVGDKVVCERWRRGRRRSGVVQNQKQEPHTKMWGNKLDDGGISEGSLEVKLPEIWTNGKADVERAREEKRSEEKSREEKRRSEKRKKSEGRRCRYAKRVFQ